MTKFAAGIALVALCASTVAAQSPAGDSATMMAAGYKRYAVQSGIVEYTYSGTQSGSETLYFDRWGLREAKYTETEISIMGFKQSTKTLTLLDGEWMYTVDLAQKTGTKIQNPMLKSWADGSANKDLSQVGEQMMQGMKAEKVGTEVIGGKTCEVWEVKSLGTTACVWHGVTLKTDVNLMGQRITMTATRVQEGGSVPEERFSLPDDVKFGDSENLQNLLDTLKKKTRPPG